MPQSNRSRLPFAAGASLLLATGVLAALQRRAAERDNPPRGRWVRAAGVRLHALEAGDGPATALLIHGNAVTADDWARSGVFSALARRMRVLAPDRPGCGWTRGGENLDARGQAHVLAALLERRAHGPAVVVGHSLGAEVALWLALDRPDLARGVLLIAPYASPTARLDGWMSRLMLAPPVAALGAPRIGAVIARLAAPLLARRLFGPAPTPPGYVDGPLAMGLRPRQYRAGLKDAAIMAAEGAALAPRLSRLRQPVLILVGGRDRVVDPERQAARLAEAIPGARLRLLPEAGHMAHHASPDSVVEGVLRLAGPRTAMAGAPSSRPMAASMA